MALVKAERERRTARAQLWRHPSLLSGELPAAGLRRVALGQLDVAIELLESDSGGGIDRSRIELRTVHETRKTLKRLRALMRLLAPVLGRKRFERENAALRDCARRLAAARDAEVMVDTLDALLRRHPELTAARADGIAAGPHRLRAQLVLERERTAPLPGYAEIDRLHTAAADLRAIRARVARWNLPERPGSPAKLTEPGLERIYRKGRRRMRRARRRGGLDAMHAWRKSVKDLRYAAEMCNREGAKPHTKSARRLRRVARRADRIGELLGEEHDLGLLARVIHAHPEHFKGERRARKTLLAHIARRRKRLRRRALREGERLYRRKPGRFARRLRTAP